MSQSSQENALRHSLFSRRLQTIKKRLWYRSFPVNFANSLRTSFNTSGHCFWSYLVTEKRTQVSNDIVIIVNGRKSCLEFHADLYSDICYLKPILQVNIWQYTLYCGRKLWRCYKLVEQNSIRLFQWFLHNQMTADRINFIF